MIQSIRYFLGVYSLPTRCVTLHVARRKQNLNVKHMSKIHCEIGQSEMFIEQHKLSYLIPTLPLDDYAVQ